MTSSAFRSYRGDPAVAKHQAIIAHGTAVRRQALVLGFSDAFAMLGIVLVLAAVILLLTKRPKAVGGAGAH